MLLIMLAFSPCCYATLCAPCCYADILRFISIFAFAYCLPRYAIFTYAAALTLPLIADVSPYYFRCFHFFDIFCFRFAPHCFHLPYSVFFALIIDEPPRYFRLHADYAFHDFLLSPLFMLFRDAFALPPLLTLIFHTPPCLLRFSLSADFMLMPRY